MDKAEAKIDLATQHNTIKDEYWYIVEECDANEDEQSKNVGNKIYNQTQLILRRMADQGLGIYKKHISG